ncbi:COG1683: Uncharacterized conserved protein / FIG143828: Hypothetical protein YbgA [Olavius algarvensis associated proteobacterium Delta 3]|nr:COG1683: Uncharacterized conserved protein / FIG143828: Hypothetical protein YbgA [Olavius algarvensis associated proteobacterium Delta 3]
MTETIKIGVSTCLLGEPVRYDGGHKRNRYVTDTLSEYFDFVPVCPEVECGMPIPRESMRLVGNPENPRLLTIKTKIDHTDQMKTWAQARLKALEKEDLCGYIFKKDSPSSGLFRVKVYTDKGMPHKVGTGLWARAFTEHFPLIPVEEEGRLNDPHLRENFIERIFAMKRWRETLAKRRSVGNIVDFHTRHKLLVLSHSPKHYRAMGKLVATGKSMAVKELYGDYETMLTEALGLRTTLKKNSNVLQHMLGYFKKQLTADEKQELLEIIDDYRNGLVPLVVPITLFNHYVRKYQQAYLDRQVYLRPHPVALKLRNHA